MCYSEHYEIEAEIVNVPLRCGLVPQAYSCVYSFLASDTHGYVTEAKDHVTVDPLLSIHRSWCVLEGTEYGLSVSWAITSVKSINTSLVASVDSILVHSSNSSILNNLHSFSLSLSTFVSPYTHPRDAA